MTMTTEERAAAYQALVTLMNLALVNWEVMKGIAFSLSYNGLSRPQIVDFFLTFMVRHERDISERDLDMVGDVNSHLVGQCNTFQIIRLVNDPEDLDALARRVADDMRGWTPPDENRSPDSKDDEAE
jgi:hypothetical protein